MIFSYRVLINIAVDEGGRPLKHMRFLGEPLGGPLLEQLADGDPPTLTLSPFYYQPGDLMVETWRGTIEAADFELAINEVWKRHNDDDRPDGRIGPSLSVGDVVVITDGGTERAVAIEPIPCDVSVPTNIYAGTWVAFMDQIRHLHTARG